VDAFVDADRVRHKAILDLAKSLAADDIRRMRDEHLRAPEQAFRRFPRLLPESRSPAAAVLSEVFRSVAQDAKAARWMPNDALDLLHVIVPLAYVDGLVLDGQWARRVKRIGFGPPGFAQVFAMGAIDSFLEWFERRAAALQNAEAPFKLRGPRDT
jgi:hypothetical protein